MSSAFRTRLPARTLMRALAVAGALLLGLLMVAACGGGAAQPTAAPLPTPAPATTAPEAPVPTNTTVPTATLAPTEPPAPTATATTEPTPTAEPVADASNCVTCHTSEETLQQLAKEEAPAEKLSEGEG